jgi:D-alanine-D-alanine ligase
MTKVHVIAGGNSDERAVSLRSGQAVAAALAARGYEVMTDDPTQVALGSAAVDVAFPVVHGAGGEDGTLQAQLDALGLVYVGSGMTASELCFNKATYREVLQQHELPVAEGTLVDIQAFASNPLSQAPYVLKQYDGGSSIDTLVVRDPAAVVPETIGDIFAKHPQMLLEQLIEGTEITVPVLGDKALPIIEIIPPSGGEFDYENKYNGASQELCPALHVSDAVQEQAQRLAEKIHSLCGCRDYSRTDMIIRSDGSLVVLETNTIPGMTEQSLFPKAAAAAGLSMPALCAQLVEMALSRRTAIA